MAEQIALDRTDLRVLALLQREGRLPNSELAGRVNLSPSACLRRVQRLEAAGVITGYGARLDPLALGLGLQAFVRVQLQKHGQESVAHFAQNVQDWDEVVTCACPHRRYGLPVARDRARPRAFLQFPARPAAQRLRRGRCEFQFRPAHGEGTARPAAALIRPRGLPGFCESFTFARLRCPRASRQPLRPANPAGKLCNTPRRALRRRLSGSLPTRSEAPMTFRRSPVASHPLVLALGAALSLPIACAQAADAAASAADAKTLDKVIVSGSRRQRFLGKAPPRNGKMSTAKVECNACPVLCQISEMAAPALATAMQNREGACWCASTWVAAAPRNRERGAQAASFPTARLPRRTKWYEATAPDSSGATCCMPTKSSSPASGRAPPIPTTSRRPSSSPAKTDGVDMVTVCNRGHLQLLQSQGEDRHRPLSSAPRQAANALQRRGRRAT